MPATHRRARGSVGPTATVRPGRPRAVRGAQGKDPWRGAPAPRNEGRRGGFVIDDVIARWHRYLGGDLPGGLDGLLADEVVFYSPVVYTPQQGKSVTTQYLEAASLALAGGAGKAFRY